MELKLYSILLIAEILSLVYCKSCPEILLDHGKIVSEASYTNGSMITLECDPGYSLVGLAILTCGSWDTQPSTCVPKTCGPFNNIPNGKTTQMAENGIEDSYNSVMEVNCNDGYILNGRKYVRCTEAGTWESKPSCEETMCPPYPGLSSTCVHNTLFANSKLYIKCKDDVQVTQIGGGSTTCDDGHWKDLSLTCHCDCKLDDTPESVILTNLNKQGYLGHTKTLEWECKQGFTKNASVSIKCTDGKVNGCPSCKKVTDNTQQSTDHLTVIIVSIAGGIGFIVVFGVLVCIVTCRRRATYRDVPIVEDTKGEDHEKCLHLQRTKRGNPVRSPTYRS